MKPLDPRLLRASASARRYVAVTAVFQAATVVAVIVGAVALAALLADLVTDPGARGFAAQAGHLTVLGTALLIRVALSYVADRYAHRAASATITGLRTAALDVLTDPRRTSPRRLLAERSSALTIVLRGLDRLTDYFAGYLPALAATVIVTPVVIGVIAWIDWLSAVLIVVTIPLVPIFMVLIGMVTRERTERKLAAMSDQTAQLLDLLAGIPTLRALGRAQAPAARVGALAQRLRTSTMSALRIAFLSGAALELIATLGVALVAVGIGLRLVYGEMSLYAGVLALVLAPEAYLPLRKVGAQFHNAQDGVTAADEVLGILDAPAPPDPGTAKVSLVGSAIELAKVGVRGRDSWAPHDLDLQVRPGEVTVLTGANGAGKSTAIEVVLGLIEPDQGVVTVAGRSIVELSPDDYRAQIGWLPQ